MPAKRCGVEQVAKLPEAKKHQGQGLTIPLSWKRLGSRSRRSTAGGSSTGVEGGRGAAAESSGAGKQPLEEDSWPSRRWIISLLKDLKRGNW
jgi:hypothetical protein